jgi:hypothetical protein
MAVGSRHTTEGMKMPVQTAQGQWIDDDVEQAILTLARMPKDQKAVPAGLIEQAQKAKDELQLIDMALR